jgi:hypothetical protein
VNRREPLAPAGRKRGSWSLETENLCPTTPNGRLSIAPGGKGIVYVDDALNTLRLLH